MYKCILYSVTQITGASLIESIVSRERSLSPAEGRQETEAYLTPGLCPGRPVNGRTRSALGLCLSACCSSQMGWSQVGTLLLQPEEEAFPTTLGCGGVQWWRPWTWELGPGSAWT